MIKVVYIYIHIIYVNISPSAHWCNIHVIILINNTIKNNKVYQNWINLLLISESNSSKINIDSICYDMS